MVLRCPKCGLYLYTSGKLDNGEYFYTCKLCPGITLEKDAIKEK